MLVAETAAAAPKKKKATKKRRKKAAKKKTTKKKAAAKSKTDPEVLRTRRILRGLHKLYPDPQCALDHDTPFQLLIATILSAQCTDERVNKVTPDLFALADNPAAMAGLDVEKIREVIRPCGLSPQKSKAISGLSMLL